jgi:hypothetical protein
MGNIDDIHHAPCQGESHSNIHVNGAQKYSIEKDLQAQINFSLFLFGGTIVAYLYSRAFSQNVSANTKKIEGRKSMVSFFDKPFLSWCQEKNPK